jgi:hypothetical protein
MEENGQLASAGGAEETYIWETQSLRRAASVRPDEDFLGTVLERRAECHSAIGEEPGRADGSQPVRRLFDVRDGLGRRRSPAADRKPDQQSGEDGCRCGSDKPDRPARKDA